MRSHRGRAGRVMVLAAVIALSQLAVGVSTVAAGDPVGPAVESFTYSPNMTPIGYSARVSTNNSSDLAFWGNRAYQGTYNGFRILDISNPADPIELTNFTNCPGSQGDIVVWENLLVRSWDAPSNSQCAGVPTGTGFEGLHFFDVSNPAAPVLLGQLRLAAAARPVELTVNPPSAAAGSYLLAAAAYGPLPTLQGLSSSLANTNAAANPAWPLATPTMACGPLIGFPAGSIAIVDRGQCTFVEKTANAAAAGASAVIVVNNVAGNPTAPGGTDPTATIPTVMIGQTDGATVRAGLPATGNIHSNVGQCGSHTNTILPDVARGNLYMYVGGSAAGCPGIDIVRVPINNPTAATWVRREPSGRSCHDNTVFLGTTNRIVCAGGNGFTVWSVNPALAAAAEGGFEDPVQIRSTSVAGVQIGHSSAITYDGKVMVFGHEPGGGSAARCQAVGAGGVTVTEKSLFFYSVETGDLLGTFVQPRDQTAAENCTWHNFNVIPTNRGYGLVTGNYQMGISVIDFTNPASPFQIAFADPAPLGPTVATSGGDWSTYWYNGNLYESDMRRGLIIWDLDHRLADGTVSLPHANPQTSLINIALDTSAPVITLNEPKHAATFAVGATGNYALGSSQTVDFSCADAQSAILSCVGTLPDGSLFDTSTVGTHTFTVNAQNGALGTSSVTHTYNVVWANNTGLLPALDDGGTTHAKAGSAVPIKFSLGAFYGLDILSGALRSRQVNCTTGAPLGPETSNGAAGATGFRYDAGADQYIFNWKTDKSWADTCRQLIVSFDDNTVHTVTMSFVK